MELNGLINSRKAVIDHYLGQLFNYHSDFQADIVNAMAYSVRAGGKRLRAILLLEAYAINGGSDDIAMPFAASIECIHTYSLIHDDLPAMDDDELRRGKPTNHVVHGEALAILAGDALLNYAFEIMCEHSMAMDNAKAGLAAMQTIALAAGFRGMIGGQVMDIKSQGGEQSKDILNYIHSHKTGALIEAAVVAGAQLAGDVERLDIYRSFGRHLGMAFQITDDVLDVIGDRNRLGKPIGSDDEHAKLTYPKLYGIEASQRMAADYTERALSDLGKLCSTSSYLYRLSQVLLKRKF